MINYWPFMLINHVKLIKLYSQLTWPFFSQTKKNYLKKKKNSPISSQKSTRPKTSLRSSLAVVTLSTSRGLRALGSTQSAAISDEISGRSEAKRRSVVLEEVFQRDGNLGFWGSFLMVLIFHRFSWWFLFGFLCHCARCFFFLFVLYFVIFCLLVALFLFVCCF